MAQFCNYCGAPLDPRYYFCSRMGGSLLVLVKARPDFARTPAGIEAATTRPFEARLVLESIARGYVRVETFAADGAGGDQLLSCGADVNLAAG